MKIKIQNTLTCLAVALFILTRSAAALDTDEYSGLAADSLTVTVGYFGGPYYEKAVFTLDELWAMDVRYVDYTFIDNMPSVVIEHVAGVTLDDLMDAAGIDLGSIQRFNFWTNDKQGGYYTSITKAYLIDTPRYCYYSLPDNFDYDSGAGGEYAVSDAQRVPTMMALADDWGRALAGASFGSDYMGLNTNTRFRLVYGQTDAVERTASNSAKWVHLIEVTLGGAPTLTLDVSVLDLEVGSKFRSEARVQAADSVVSENARVEWSSSDGSVVSVDENGEIAVLREGSATVTARYGDQAVSVLVNGLPSQSEAGVGAGAGALGRPDGGGESGDADAAPAQDGAGADLAAEPPEDGEQTPGLSVPADGGTATHMPESAEAAEAAESGPETETPQGEAPVLRGFELKAVSAGDEGGVQNWRGEEMADTAVELPVIQEDNPMLPAAAAVFALIFIAGGLWRFILYKKSV
ncbi:MAG: Ig-like domain-containing protein [Oscillospiraceae bacterium]|nr:Ig-like domain-containing protein [Oscillospiraceae bacterium]